MDGDFDGDFDIPRGDGDFDAIPRGDGHEVGANKPVNDTVIVILWVLAGLTLIVLSMGSMVR